MANGLGIRIKGGGGGGSSGIVKVADEAARLALSPAQGDYVVQLDDGTLWYYNGVAWELQADGSTAMYIRDTDSIDLSVTANDPPYNGDTNTLEADVRISSNAADVNYQKVDINVESTVSPGLRAQLANSQIRAVLSATAPLAYDNTTGVFSMPSATNASDGYATAAQILALETVIQGLLDHLADTSGAHAASAISFTPVGNISSTDVQTAIAEVQSDYEAADSALDGRLDALELIDHVAVTIGAFGSTPTANGISVSGTDNQTLTLQPADASNPGAISTVAQVMGNGTKSFQAGVAIGTTSAPDTKSILDLVSTTLGFLMPRMTTAQRDAIASPTTGLHIYNTTTGRQEVYDGTVWQSQDGSIVVFNTAQSLSASGTITASQNKRQRRRVAGNAAAITVDTTTAITNGVYDGQELWIVGTDDTNTVTITNTGNVKLNGSITLGLDDMIYLIWDGNDSKWAEVTRFE